MTRSVQFFKPFQFLESVSNESILFAITDEHPQTVAVILSCMQPVQAAYIIEALAPEEQLSVSPDVTHEHIAILPGYAVLHEHIL